jgi:hypothetical protein
MSLENQGVIQLLKEVTFRRILTFCKPRKWDRFSNNSDVLQLVGKMTFVRPMGWWDWSGRC